MLMSVSSETFSESTEEEFELPPLVLSAPPDFGGAASVSTTLDPLVQL